ncbi:MAG: SIMPL domain-containing protein [Gammaproteobacteria bacterium]
MKFLHVSGFLFMMMLQTLVVADEDKQPMDQVNFQIDVDTEVENDQINVVLSIHEKNRHPAQLAVKINDAMAWALEIARSYDKIDIKTGSYQTYPVYNNKRISSWRGQQDLLLQGSEVSAISELTGRLQERLQVQSMRFSVSRERQRQEQEKLISDALQAFQKRAALIAKNLGATGYDIETVSIQSSGQPYMPRMRMESMTKTTSMASAPAMEAGSSKVQVTVSGAVRLRQ